MTVGTWAWAERTGGRLSRRDQLDQVLRGARARVLLRRGAGIAGHVELAERPPDSAFARAALEAAREESSVELLEHCLRTWLWGDLIAQADRVQHDPELLYVTCLLHDLGLTPRHWCREAECFAVEGARAARSLAGDHGYQRADALAEAIALHLNVTVPPELGSEAHLLHAGAAMDVVGARAAELPPDVRSEVLRRHPRAGFAEELEALTARQAAARPRSRTALLRRLGFAGLIRQGERTFM